MDQPTSARLHRADRMASEQLAVGIEGFSKVFVGLEQLFEDLLEDLQAQAEQFGSPWHMPPPRFVTDS
jgi:hypothetical protein